MWRNQPAVHADHEALKYCAFVLGSIQGFTPPHSVNIPALRTSSVIELLAQQVWHLERLNTVLNMRLYYELIPEAFREMAKPVGFVGMEPDGSEFTEKTALIYCLKAEQQIVEVVILVIELDGRTTYFHRLVRYHCDNIREREALIAEHGIPPTHPMAVEWPLVSLELNDFLRREKPEVIIGTQKIVMQILDPEFQPKYERYKQLPWDERPGLHAYYFAIKIKYLRESHIYHKCPFHCHERYDITFSNLKNLDGTNAGYSKFIGGYRCAHTDVNEMYFQLRDSRMIRLRREPTEARTDES